MLLSQGYNEVAQICLTHSFNNQTTDEYIGKLDSSEEELKMIQDALKVTNMDEYDRLVQRCDSIAGVEGVLDIEERMERKHYRM